MFNIFIAIALLLVGGSGIAWYQSAQSVEESPKTTESLATEDVRVYSKDEVTVSFSDDDQSAQLSLPGVTDVVYSLNKVTTETGVQYRTADGQVVFTPENETVSVREQMAVQPVATEDEKINQDFLTPKQGGVADGVDQDCDDVTTENTACSPGDPIPGIDITVEQGGEIDALDTDDDNDSLPTEAQMESDIEVNGQIESEKATDYNSSRSNKSY